MTDLPNEIFKKYGPLAILFAFVAAFLIWGIAHWAASPGTEVSVLWGLVKYTKSSTNEFSSNVSLNTQASDLNKAQSNNLPDTLSKKSSDTSNSEKVRVLPVLNIEMIQKITKDNYKMTLNELRERRGLRELTTLESGKNVTDIPASTYFFIFEAYLNTEYYSSIITSVMQGTVNRFRADGRYYELQVIPSSGICIVGFVSESDADRISHLSGQDTHDVVISAVSWGIFTTLITLPINRIESCKDRDIEFSKDVHFIVLDAKIR